MKRVKNIVLLIVCSIISLATFAQQAQILITENKHNFGEIQEQNGPVTHNFVFKNVGNSPLILNAVTASCGCTTPVWTREPVAPGKTGTIQVTYNPLNRPGAFNKNISISSNAKNSQETLYISGMVISAPISLEQEYPRELAGVRAKSNYIRIGEIKTTQVKTGVLEIANASDKPQTVEFRTPPSHIKVRVEPKTLQPKEKGMIYVEFDGRQYDNYGSVVNRLYLLSDGTASYKNSIGISADMVEDFSALTPQQLANAPKVKFDTNSHDFGNIKPNDKVSHVFKLTNTGKSSLIIRKITTSCGCTAVTPEKKVIEPGETVPVEVKFDSQGKSGRQHKTISIVTNAPSGQLTDLRISAMIQ